MEFLDINYAEVEPTTFDQNQISGILVLVDKGIASKVQMDPIVCSEELGDSFKKYVTSIGEAKSDSQDKAIVSALFSRYPKLAEDKLEIKEFKQHLSNLMKAKSIQPGGLKYLIERLMQADTLEEAGAPAPEQPQQEQPAQPQEQSKAATPQKGAQPQESNNSSEDEEFFKEWEDSYSTETELTEDDFSDLVGDGLDENYSEESELLVVRPNPAKGFLRGKLMDKQLSDPNAGFKLASKFLLMKDAEYHGGMMAMAPSKDHNDGYQTGDEVIKVNKDKAKSFLLDKRGNLVTKSMEQPKIDK